MSRYFRCDQLVPGAIDYVNTESLTAEELVEAANKRLEELTDTFQVQPEEFSTRTVYYYTRVGVLPRIRGVRKADRYPAEWAYRLLFVRRLQQQLPHAIREELSELVGEDASMLSGIARVLDALPESRIRAVALGEEPVEILPFSFGASGAAGRRPFGYTVAEPTSLHVAARAEPLGEPQRSIKAPQANTLPRPDDGGPWVLVYAGKSVRTLVREDALTPETKREIEHAARLIERALGKA